MGRMVDATWFLNRVILQQIKKIVYSTVKLQKLIVRVKMPIWTHSFSRLYVRFAASALLIVFLAPAGCVMPDDPVVNTPEKIRLIIDTDANNELDDQYALTYVLHNQDVFELEGITVNRTYSGGSIDDHYDEAARILTLAKRTEVPLYRGASATYDKIVPTIGAPDFDGHAAVDFIIERAHAGDGRELVLAPIGKLTNIALALEKDPSIASKVRILWLGSNWPKPGEYNLVNDTSSVNPVIFSEAPFEMALVRYNEFSGTAAVIMNLREVRERFPGLGPKIAEPVTGRHGGEFNNFGDYALELFEKIGDDNRALFDMAALAVLKEPGWAEKLIVNAPRLAEEKWIPGDGEATKQIAMWENFNTSLILKDFLETLERVTE